jgi:hypothetical protein
MKQLFTIWFILVLIVVLAPATFAQEDEQTRAIDIAAQSEELSEFLSGFEWEAEAYEEDEGYWGVDFYRTNTVEDDDNFLAWAMVDLDSESVIETYMPRFLSEEALERRLPEVEALVLSDPEVQAIIDNPSLWQVYTEWDPYESLFFVQFFRGLDAYTATVWLSDEESDEESPYFLVEFYDETALEAEQAEQERRDRAVMLAYEADAIDDAIFENDDWQTVVQQLNGSQYSVEFISDEERLFFAVVDIDTETVIESE